MQENQNGDIPARSDGLPADELVLETVAGPLPGSRVGLACAHEHMFADFTGPEGAGFMDVDWARITGDCVASARRLRAQGVDLLVDWTTQSLGRSVLMLRDITRQTGLPIVAATGFYKDLLTAEVRGRDIDGIADHFLQELTVGIGGTSIRAGFVKIATTETGATEAETRVHRAAARAARKAGATIAAHSPYLEATLGIVATLVSEGFDLSRFVWGHAQCSPVEEHVKLARRGVMLAYDAIGAIDDPFFRGPTDDASMLDRVETLIAAGHGDKVMISTDASVSVHPPSMQYDRHNTYLHGSFAPKLRDRVGTKAADMILRENVVRAFRRGTLAG